MLRIVIILLSLTLIACQTVKPKTIVTSPSPSASPEVSESPTPDMADNTAEDTVRLKKTTLKNKQGQKWELEAETVDWADAKSKALAQEVDWWLLGEDDEPWVKVVSPHADIDMKNQIVIFTGETIATRVGFPEEMKVQRLVYRGNEKTFHGSGGVTWRRDPSIPVSKTKTDQPEVSQIPIKVESPEVEYNTITENVVFSGETIASRIGSKERLKVRKLIYKSEDRKFYGSGGVSWQRPAAELTGETLTASADLDRIQLKGRVKGKIKGGSKNFQDSQKAN